MIRSMTGFGRAVQEIDGYVITVELKSVTTVILSFPLGCRGSTALLRISSSPLSTVECLCGKVDALWALRR